MTREEAKRILYVYRAMNLVDESHREAFDMAIEALEQEPKKGHWIIGFGERKECIVPLKDGYVTDSCSCSECGEWLTGSDEYLCSGNFCPNCGADMRG